MPKNRVFRPKYFEVENNACFFIYIVRFIQGISPGMKLPMLSQGNIIEPLKSPEGSHGAGTRKEIPANAVIHVVLHSSIQQKHHLGKFQERPFS